MEDDEKLLQTGLFAVAKSPKFEYDGLEDDLQDFLKNAEYYEGSPAADYYLKISRQLTKKLKGYDSDWFIKIRDGLEHLYEIPDEREDSETRT